MDPYLSGPVVAPVSTGGSWIAIIISVIALIAVIIVIVVLIARFPSNTHVINAAQRWTISTTNTTSGAVTFAPTTDSMLQIPTSNAGFTVTITPPTTVNTNLATIGDFGLGSMFMIDNTGNSSAIAVVPASGVTMTVRGNNATTVNIPANSTGSFIWTSTTSFRLLFTAVG